MSRSKTFQFADVPTSVAEFSALPEAALSRRPH